MRICTGPTAVLLMAVVCAPPLAFGQLLRMQATAPSDTTVLPLVVDVYRASANVSITAAGIADTLRARLAAKGYSVGAVQDSWGGALAPMYAHLVVDLWVDGGIRADLVLRCRLPVASSDTGSRSLSVGIPRQSGRAVVTLGVVGRWLSRYIPEPSSISTDACSR